MSTSTITPPAVGSKVEVVGNSKFRHFREMGDVGTVISVSQDTVDVDFGDGGPYRTQFISVKDLKQVEEFKVGDRVEIIGNGNPRHHFEIGSVGTVEKVSPETGNLNVSVGKCGYTQFVNPMHVKYVEGGEEFEFGDVVRVVANAAALGTSLMAGSYAVVREVGYGLLVKGVSRWGDVGALTHVSRSVVTKDIKPEKGERFEIVAKGVFPLNCFEVGDIVEFESTYDKTIGYFRHVNDGSRQYVAYVEVAPTQAAKSYVKPEPVEPQPEFAVGSLVRLKDDGTVHRLTHYCGICRDGRRVSLPKIGSVDEKSVEIISPDEYAEALFPIGTKVRVVKRSHEEDDVTFFEHFLPVGAVGEVVRTKQSEMCGPEYPKAIHVRVKSDSYWSSQFVTLEDLEIIEPEPVGPFDRLETGDFISVTLKDGQAVTGSVTTYRSLDRVRVAVNEWGVWVNPDQVKFVEKVDPDQKVDLYAERDEEEDYLEDEPLLKNALVEDADGELFWRFLSGSEGEWVWMDEAGQEQEWGYLAQPVRLIFKGESK